MIKTLFSFENYKDFLNATIEEHAGERGYRSRLAEAARCHRSYFSQILHGKQHLNPDQAMRLADFWHFREEEAEYFIALVELARATLPALKRLIKQRARKLAAKRQDISTRYEVGTTLDLASQAIYYGHWLHSAVHILAGVDGFQTAAAMANRLQVPRDAIDGALSHLARLGYVELRGSSIAIRERNVHLPKDSPMIVMKHANWRQRALLSAQRAGSENLHYTAIQSHSIADFITIKECLLKALDDARQIITPSPPQDVSCLCLDFFRIY